MKGENGEYGRRIDQLQAEVDGLKKVVSEALKVDFKNVSTSSTQEGPLRALPGRQQNGILNRESTLSFAGDQR